MEMISPSFMMVFFVDLLVSELIALLGVVHSLNRVIMCYLIHSCLFFKYTTENRPFFPQKHKAEYYTTDL